MGRAKRGAQAIGVGQFDAVLGGRRGTGHGEDLFSSEEEQKLTQAIDNGSPIEVYHALQEHAFLISHSPAALRLQGRLADWIVEQNFRHDVRDIRGLLGELNISNRYTAHLVRDTETHLLHINDGDTDLNNRTAWVTRCGMKNSEMLAKQQESSSASFTPKYLNIVAHGEWGELPERHCPDCVAAPVGPTGDVHASPVFTYTSRTYPLFPQPHFVDLLNSNYRKHIPEDLFRSYQKRGPDENIWNVISDTEYAMRLGLGETLVEYARQGKGYSMFKKMIPDFETEIEKPLREAFPGQDISPLLDGVLTAEDWSRRALDHHLGSEGINYFTKDELLTRRQVAALILERLL
jgi:hypothetical protein